MGANIRVITSLAEFADGGDTMDATFIVVIVFILIFCIGGPILGHYASIKSENHQNDTNKTDK